MKPSSVPYGWRREMPPEQSRSGVWTLAAIPGRRFGACALDLADAGLEFAPTSVGRLLVAFMHPSFLGNTTVHHGLLEALQSDVDALTGLQVHLYQAMDHPFSQQIVPSDLLM